MRYFPIFLDLRDRPVLVVGGGEEALRKIRLLLKTEAWIAVVAPDLHKELADEPRVSLIARHYHAGLLDGAALVFSADTALNARVAADAQAAGIPVNAADQPGLSSFIVPSIVDRDPVIVAIGTEGTAPVLGQGLRARIDAMLPNALGELAQAGAVLRERVAAAVPCGSRRRSFWQRFFFGDVREAFLAKDDCGFRSGVEGLLASEAHPRQGRVSFITINSDDPELMTLKAQRKLVEADVIVHDHGVPAAILEMARRDARRVTVPSHDFNTAETFLIKDARAGDRVVRLFHVESSLEETVAVAAEGIAFETVPSVAAPKRGGKATSPTIDDIYETVLRAAS